MENTFTEVPYALVALTEIENLIAATEELISSGTSDYLVSIADLLRKLMPTICTTETEALSLEPGTLIVTEQGGIYERGEARHGVDWIETGVCRPAKTSDLAFPVMVIITV